MVTRFWNRFWFNNVDGATWVLVRTLTGILLLAWAGSLVPDLRVLFDATGLADSGFYERGHLLTVMRWTDADLVVWLVWMALVVSSICMITGRAVKWAAPVAAVAFASLSTAMTLWIIGAEQVMRLLSVYVAAFALCSPTALVNGAIWKPASVATAVPAWGLRLLQIQFSLAYLTAAIDKLHGPSWREGYAVYWALGREDYWRFDPPGWFTRSHLAIGAATWGTLAVELALPFALWWGRSRLAAILAAIAMHAAFDMWLTLGFFGWAMAVGVLSFAPPVGVRRIIESVRLIKARRTDTRRIVRGRSHRTR